MPRQMAKALAREGAAQTQNAQDAATSSAQAAPACQAKAAAVAKPQLGTVLSLKKDTGKSTAECKAALLACGNNYESALAMLLPEQERATALMPPGQAIEVRTRH